LAPPVTVEEQSEMVAVGDVGVSLRLVPETVRVADEAFALRLVLVLVEAEEGLRFGSQLVGSLLSGKLLLVRLERPFPVGLVAPSCDRQ
jgi:hypothetical protein